MLVGAELLESFEPVLLVFAAFPVYSSHQILLGDEDEEEDFADNGIVKFFKGVADFSGTVGRRRHSLGGRCRVVEWNVKGLELQLSL